MPYQATSIDTACNCHRLFDRSDNASDIHTTAVHSAENATVLHISASTVTNKTADIVEFTTFNGNTLPESEITDAGFGIRDCKKPQSTESSFGIITYDREIVDGMEIAIESSTEHFRLSDQLRILLCRIVIIVTNRRHLLATHV